MTKYLLAAITIAIFTGCPSTGIGVVDNATQAHNSCERSFLVTNASSTAINIHMKINEAIDDSHCQPEADNQSVTVPAGQTATVKANMTCEMCDVYENYSVDSSNPSVTYSGIKMKLSGDGNSGSETATCTDTGCTGT